MPVQRSDMGTLRVATKLSELVVVANQILHRMTAPAMICGPMTTGGKEDLEANLRYFDCAVTEALLREEEIFYQALFKESMIRIIPEFRDRLTSQESRFACSFLLIADFYFPIFRTGKIKKFFFLPGWEKSIGARLEREIITGLGKSEVVEYPQTWLPSVEERYRALCKTLGVTC